MKVLWICGLPNIVRLEGAGKELSPIPTAAWSWILGHLPPPKDIELHILCPVAGLIDSRVDFEYMGVHWHCFKQNRFELLFLWIRFYFQVRSFVKDLNPDIIHGWGGETGCGRVATLLSRKAIVSVQGLLLWFWELLKVQGERRTTVTTRLSWVCEKKTYDRAKFLIVESEASRDGLKKYYDKAGFFIPHPLRKAFLDIPVPLKISGKIKMVFLGSLVDRKGAMDAVVAFSKMKHSASELVMIGEGPEMAQIDEFIKENGLKDRVRLAGNLSTQNIIVEFSDAQFFLLPSYGDTGPTALKEALSMGLFPICYANSGPEDLITHYKCGKLVETGNIDVLVKAVSECVNDVDAYTKRARIASSLVRDELSHSNVWSKLLGFYQLNCHNKMVNV